MSISYVCEKCKKSIADGKGLLWLDMSDVREYKQDVRVWIKDGRKGRPPLKPRWMAHHAACQRLMPPARRTLRVDQVRTERGLTKATVALMESLGDDLALTDWLDMMRYVAYSGGADWFNGKAR